MIRLPWKRPPPKPSPDIARAVDHLAEQTARVAQLLEQRRRADERREGKPA